MHYLTIKDFLKITSFLTRYELDVICGLREGRIAWDEEEKVSFEVDYSDRIDHKRVPKMTKIQAALAVVIYNDVEIRWYNKSRNRGRGANFETEKRTMYEWSEKVEEFLLSHPDFKVTEWNNYLVESWPDNYDKVE